MDVGTHQLELLVTDNDGQTGSEQIRIEIRCPSIHSHTMPLPSGYAWTALEPADAGIGELGTNEQVIHTKPEQDTCLQPVIRTGDG